MLTQAKNRRMLNFSALLLIYYIAVGIPLIHQALHESHEHGHQTACCSIHRHLLILENSEEHICPICSFLAVNQFCLSSPTLQIDFNQAFRVAGTYFPPVQVKPWVGQVEPRAPPIACVSMA
jgi:hypothetical protein